MDVEKCSEEIRFVVVIIESVVESRIACWWIIEEGIEPRDKRSVAAELVNQSLSIVRDICPIDISAAFIERRIPITVIFVGIEMHRCKRREPASVGVARASRARLIAPHVHPVF